MGIKIFYRYLYEGVFEQFVEIPKLIHEEIRRLAVQRVTDLSAYLSGNKAIAYFTVYIMEGCEPFYFYMRSALKEGEAKWRGRSYTKTEFARDRVKAHKLVVACLDACRRHGVLKCVFDTSGYWKDRDEGRLKEAFEISREAINDRAFGLIDEGYQRVVRGDGRVHRDEGKTFLYGDELELESKKKEKKGS